MLIYSFCSLQSAIFGGRPLPIIYFLITITFSVSAFFVAFLCSRVCVIKHSMCLNFSVFHRSEIALQIFLRVANGTIVTLIPLSFFL